MKNLLFIYNPVAGMTKNRIGLQKIIEYYDREDYLVTVCLVNRLRDFKEQMDFDRYDLIVCCGGDGTLNMTVSFFIEENCRKELAYIPAGSTNDFAYSLGLSRDADAALLSTIEGKPKKIDIGQFNGIRYFLYVAAFGAFTKVSYSTSQKAKNLLGHAAYILEGIKSLSDLKSYHMIVELEGEKIEGDFILGMVTNSLSIGGFKNLLPQDSTLDDGEFELVLVKMPRSIGALNEIAISLLGEKPEENQHIYYRKISEITLKSEEIVSWTLDGEFGGDTKVANIKNKKELLSVIC